MQGFKSALFRVESVTAELLNILEFTFDSKIQVSLTSSLQWPTKMVKGPFRLFCESTVTCD